MTDLVSIIICTRNRADSLRETLVSIAGCEIPAGISAEVLIVDNGSTDHTRKAVAEAKLTNARLRYILEDRQGQCHARNRGLAESDGEVILFTDDDVRVPALWVESMCRPILSNETDATTGQIALAPHLQPAWLSAAHRAHLLEIGNLSDQHARQPFLIGANMAFGRRVLERVVGFDTNLGPGASGFMDDTLFYLQLIQAGFRLTFTKGLPVEHHCDPIRLTRAAQLESARAHGASAAYVMHHWGHERVQRLRWRMVGNALRSAMCRWQWMMGAEVGFCPAELDYVERFWTYWELGKLVGKERLYQQKALTRESDAKPGPVVSTVSLPKILNEH